MMNTIVQENKLVSPFFLFFLMQTGQTGIGALIFQNHIIKGAGKDSWVSVLVVGLTFHLIFLMMLFILKQSTAGDILSFHKEVFGNVFGGILNIVLSLYFSLACIFTLHSYIDILQIWVFERVASWEFSLIFSIVIFYIVAGGFRTVTAIAFWGFVIPMFLFLSLFYLIRYLEFTYLLPFFQHSLKDYYVSAKEAALIYLGFETMLIYFPFIKARNQSAKWGHLALIFSTIVYTSIAIVTFMFFTQEKLEYLIWPTLTMIKILRFSFLERFEFIFIVAWLLVIIPVMCIYLWSAVRCIKVTMPKLKATYVLIGFLVILFIINSFLVEIEYTHMMRKLSGYIGLSILYGYIPFLFIIAFIKK